MIDGVQRTKEESERVSASFAATFSTASGQEVLRTLKNASTYRVMPNTSTSEALWHLEGQRHVVMMIEQFIAANRPKGERE